MEVSGNETDNSIFENISEPARFALTPPKPYVIFQAVFLSVILVITIFGNMAVCYVVYRTRSINTGTGMCMTSLSIADLLRSCIVLPFVIEASVHLGVWNLGPNICNVVGFLNTLFGSASVMTLAAVSLDRYVAIMKPLKYSTIVTPIRAGFMVAIIWIMSATMATLPLIGWSEYRFIPWICLCVADWNESRTYAYTCLVLTLITPLFILLYCYFKIFRIAKQQLRKVVSLERTSVETSRPVFIGKPKTRMRKEKKAAMILFAVLGVFIVCVMPFCVVYLVSSYDVSDRIFVALGITSILSFINSAVNPLIYGILNRKFRRVFFEVLPNNGCLCRRRNSVEQSPKTHHPADFISDYLGKSTTLPPRKLQKLIPRECYSISSRSCTNRGCASHNNVLTISLSSSSNVCLCALGDTIKQYPFVSKYNQREATSVRKMDSWGVY